MSYVESTQKAEALKKQLDDLMPLKKEDEERLWKKFRLEWNYNSNHIEGNTLTYHETELYLIFGRTTGDHLGREYSEMKAHDAAVEMVREWAKDKDRDITEADIRILNKMILVEPYYKRAETPDGKETEKLIEPGQYKQLPNSVRLPSGEMHPFASPESTPTKMEKLMEKYRMDESHYKLHPFQLAAEFHHELVSIHPFDDGNGRVARLVMNYILMKGGNPPVIIKAADKQSYYAALQKADAGDRTAFMEYITDQLIWSLELSIKAAKGESIEEPEDLDKEISILNKRLEKFTDNIVNTKTIGALDDVLNEVIEPLIIDICKKLEKIIPLFASTNLSYFINGAGTKTNEINDLISKINSAWAQNTPNINDLNFNTYLVKLKKLGTQAFDIHNSLKFIFDWHKFSIEIEYGPNPDSMKEFLYDRMPTEKQMNEIATRFVRRIVNEIEQRIKEIQDQKIKNQ